MGSSQQSLGDEREEQRMIGNMIKLNISVGLIMLNLHSDSPQCHFSAQIQISPKSDLYFPIS